MPSSFYSKLNQNICDQIIVYKSHVASIHNDQRTMACNLFDGKWKQNDADVLSTHDKIKWFDLTKQMETKENSKK